MAARTMDPEEREEEPERPRKPRRQISTGAVIGVANCALGGVTTPYVTSHSVPVTLTAAGAAELVRRLQVPGLGPADQGHRSGEDS